MGNFFRVFLPTFGQLSDTSSENSQIVLVSNKHLAPESFRRSMSSSSYCNILNWNNKMTFHQICFLLMISGKYSTDSSWSPSMCWTTSDTVSTFTSSPAAVEGFSNIAKFPAWAFLFQLWSFNLIRMRWGCQWNRRLSFPFLVVSD